MNTSSSVPYVVFGTVSSVPYRVYGVVSSTPYICQTSNFINPFQAKGSEKHMQTPRMVPIHGERMEGEPYQVPASGGRVAVSMRGGAALNIPRSRVAFPKNGGAIMIPKSRMARFGGNMIGAHHKAMRYISF